MKSEINPPSVYYEWVELLDMLKGKTDDSAVLNALQKGTVEWVPGVSERLTRKFTDAINSRIKAASESFIYEINNNYGQEASVIHAVLTLRKEMDFLSQAVSLPVIPENERVQYYSLVRKQADYMQTLFEESAKADRSGKMASIARNNRINTF